jgi:hypothetical protein
MNVEHYYCDNCGCTFSVDVAIRSTTYVVKTVVGSRERYEDKCPSCNCGMKLRQDSEWQHSKR